MRLATRFAEAVGAALFVAVFCIFVAKLAARYLFAVQFVWADEVCTILFVWIIFWGSALLVPDRAQIRFDLVVRALPRSARRVATIARLLLVGGLFIAATPGAIDYILFLARQRTPVLEIPLDRVYACFGIFLVAVCVRSIAGLFATLRPTWEPEH